MGARYIGVPLEMSHQKSQSSEATPSLRENNAN